MDEYGVEGSADAVGAAKFPELAFRTYDILAYGHLLFGGGAGSGPPVVAQAYVLGEVRVLLYNFSVAAQCAHVSGFDACRTEVAATSVGMGRGLSADQPG